MTKGIIYILTNPAMPDLIKVGKTTIDVGYEKRISGLYSTGVPFPFDCEYACIVDNYEQVERKIHNAFAGNRVNPKREFFELSPLKVIDILELLNPKRIDIKTEYEDKQEEIATQKAERKNEIRSRLKFSDLGIKIGSVLYYLYDKDITCKVDVNNKIIFRDEIISPSKAVQTILQEKGFKGTRVNGYLYWSLDGEESLYDMRIRLENDE